MFKNGIDIKDFSDKLVNKVLYSGAVESNDKGIVSISVESGGDKHD